MKVSYPLIKPNVAHAMVFTKDTTFLNLVRGERDHEKLWDNSYNKKSICRSKEKNFVKI